MNIADILEQHRVPVARAGHHHVSHGWIGTDCCWCGASNKHLGIRLSDGRVTCWRCGSHRLGDTLAKLTGLPWPEIKRLVGGLDLRTAPRPEHTGRLRLPKGLGPLQPVHRRYLKSRGFDPDHLERLWGLQGIGLASRLAWRVFIPVTDERGATVSWTTRATGDAGPRYLSATDEESAVPIKSVLYGAQNTRHAVLIVEGPTGVWRFGPGTVATLGVGYSRAQLALLGRYPVRAVMFDPEPEAQRRARKLADDLSVFPGRTFNVELDAEDPGEARPREVRQVRRAVFGD